MTHATKFKLAVSLSLASVLLACGAAFSGLYFIVATDRVFIGLGLLAFAYVALRTCDAALAISDRELRASYRPEREKRS